MRPTHLQSAGLRRLVLGILLGTALVMAWRLHALLAGPDRPAWSDDRIVLIFPCGSDLLLAGEQHSYRHDGEGGIELLHGRIVGCHEGRPLVIDREGRLLGLAEDPLVLPADCRVDRVVLGGGRIWLGDGHGDCVWILNGQGDLVGRIDGVETPPGIFPMGCDASGRLHLANSRRFRVQIHDADGRLLASHGERSRERGGYAGCCNPIGLWVLADGRYLVSEQQPYRLRLMGRDGEPLKDYPLAEGDGGEGAACGTECPVFGGISPLAMPDGRVLAFDHESRRLIPLGSLVPPPRPEDP